MSHLTEREKYIHRELSWLAFNERVLEEAEDKNNPLLERLKFASIAASNLDEFFMVRVAGIKRLVAAGYNRKDRFGYYPNELLEEIQEFLDEFVRRLYKCYRRSLFEEMGKEGIKLKTFEDCSPEQQKYVKHYFEAVIFPTCTPMAVDQGRPCPVMPSKKMAFCVHLLQDDKLHMALLPIPKNLDRVLRLPSGRQSSEFILIEDIIGYYLQKFFKGYDIKEYALFRFVRDSDLSVDEDYTDDLLKAIQIEIKKRAKAKIVTMEVDRSCSREFTEKVCEILDYQDQDIPHVDRTLDLSFLFSLIGKVDRPDLCFRDFPPAKIDYDNIFERINEGDFLNHVPFQSFYPTVDLIRAAAADENVLAIKMTLYRTSKDSPIIQALKEAAQGGKQVSVLVEIKARFDEEQNIAWVKELEDGGCHVLYGIANLKIHSKMALIVRKEEGRIRRYVHLATGNYNEKTARVYTDLGYFTDNEDFARDISDMFNVITGYSEPSEPARVVSAPHDLRAYFFDLINQEINWHKQYKNGRIMAKINSLEDVKMIDKLYEASAAGVQVQLIVRGICCLWPGKEKLSKNIEVKSIVGRFLEHTRMFMFNNNGDPRVFLSSADWMTRNLDHRIELLFEIFKTDIRNHLVSILELYWKDTVKSRWLQEDKNYIRAKSKKGARDIQDLLIDEYGTKGP